MHYLSNHRRQKFNSRRVQGNWDAHTEGIRETCGIVFFRRMNSITNAEDAVANKVVYHEAQPKPIKIENFVKTLSTIDD